MPPAEAAEGLTWLATPGRRCALAPPRHQHLRERQGPQGPRASALPAGPHGRTRRRNAGSEYLAQLQEKQKAKYIYGVLERQFRRTYEEAIRLQGATGENLLRLLEQRLDNVVYRAGWASTRPQARQFVNHGLIQVDGKRVDIASYRVRKGEVVSLSPKAQEMIVIQHNIDMLDRSRRRLARGRRRWQAGHRPRPARSASTSTCPSASQLIVELYSK